MMSMPKAKDVSLIAKIVAAVLFIAGAVLKWTNVFPNCNIEELWTVVKGLVLIFTTVDINIGLDKFKTNKEQENEMDCK